MKSSRTRIVVKLGTQVVVDQDSGTVALDRVVGVIKDIATLKRQGVDVILVSSGAVGLGRQALALTGALTLPQKQACAAIGQSKLMAMYGELFATYGITLGQVLVTAHDFTNRSSYVNLRNSFECLLELGVVPVVNENDVVSVAGIKSPRDEQSTIPSQQRSFDDNDKLSALVATKLSADTLIILTNVDGVYTDNPATNPNSCRIARISSLAELSAVDCQGQSALGRGGMASKLEAAKIAGLCGVRTVISAAGRANPVAAAFQEECGTVINLQGALSGDSTLSGRERWIGLASGYAGVVSVDRRAAQRLLAGQSSLLPVGVLSVVGDFEVGDIVSIITEDGIEVARGIASQCSATLSAVKGKRSAEVEAVLAKGEKPEVVHRDDMVLFGEIIDAE